MVRPGSQARYRPWPRWARHSRADRFRCGSAAPPPTCWSCCAHWLSRPSRMSRMSISFTKACFAALPQKSRTIPRWPLGCVPRGAPRRSLGQRPGRRCAKAARASSSTTPPSRARQAVTGERLESHVVGRRGAREVRGNASRALGDSAAAGVDTLCPARRSSASSPTPRTAT